MINLNAIARRFLLGEVKASPSIHSYIQSLNEIINNIAPKSQRDSRRLDIAKDQIREIKKLSRKLEERVQILEEQINILEEKKENK